VVAGPQRGDFLRDVEVAGLDAHARRHESAPGHGREESHFAAVTQWLRLVAHHLVQRHPHRLAARQAPAVGAEVRAGFLFDVPVRFATDRLDINAAAFAAGEAPSVPLIEVREVA